MKMNFINTGIPIAHELLELQLRRMKEQKAIEETNTECNCWHCNAERLFHARRVSINELKLGKVYLYQKFNEMLEEFDTLEGAKQFVEYADENLPYWNYDPVTIIDLNNEEQILKYRKMGWI